MSKDTLDLTTALMALMVKHKYTTIDIDMTEIGKYFSEGYFLEFTRKTEDFSKFTVTIRMQGAMNDDQRAVQAEHTNLRA